MILTLTSGLIYVLALSFFIGWLRSKKPSEELQKYLDGVVD